MASANAVRCCYSPEDGAGRFLFRRPPHVPMRSRLCLAPVWSPRVEPVHLPLSGLGSLYAFRAHAGHRPLSEFTGFVRHVPTPGGHLSDYLYFVSGSIEGPIVEPRHEARSTGSGRTYVNYALPTRVFRQYYSPVINTAREAYWPARLGETGRESGEGRSCDLCGGRGFPRLGKPFLERARDPLEVPRDLGH